MKLARESAVYHLLSGTSRGVFSFHVQEKERLPESLWKVVGFFGVVVVTYALMSNHFHLFVRVPEKTAADAALTDAEVLSRAGELRSEYTIEVM